MVRLGPVIYQRFHSHISSQGWDEMFLNISNPKGLGQMIIPNVVGHLVVFFQQVCNPNTIGLETLDYVSNTTRMSSTNVGKHPLDFTMRFSLKKN